MALDETSEERAISCAERIAQELQAGYRRASTMAARAARFWGRSPARFPACAGATAGMSLLAAQKNRCFCAFLPLGLAASTRASGGL